MLDFFIKYPELSSNIFWLAGESYAGKYIPDLAYKIDLYNMQTKSKKINLKGLLVGNGFMSFENVESFSIEYMIDHEFVDPDLLPYYRGSCLIDPTSAGCRYFHARYSVNIDEINLYNVYGYCFYNNSNSAENYTTANEGEKRRKHVSQGSILKNLIRNKGNYDSLSQNSETSCFYFDGILDYFSAHGKEYHAVDGMKFNGPCVQLFKLSLTK